MIKTLAIVAFTCLLNANTQVSGAPAKESMDEVAPEQPHAKSTAPPPTGHSKCPKDMELSDFGQFIDGNLNEWVRETAKAFAPHLAKKSLQETLDITPEYAHGHLENLENGKFKVFVAPPSETALTEPLFEMRSEADGNIMEFDFTCSGDVMAIEMSKPYEEIPEFVKTHIETIAEAHGVDPSLYTNQWEVAMNFDTSADELTPLNAEYELESVTGSGKFADTLMDFGAGDRHAKKVNDFTTLTDFLGDYSDTTHPHLVES